MGKYTAFSEMPIKYECTKKSCKWQGELQEQTLKKVDVISSEYCCPNCGNNEFHGLREGLRFRHIETGNTGLFVKEYKPNGKPYTMQIMLDNGQIYFAPTKEFNQV